MDFRNIYHAQENTLLLGSAWKMGLRDLILEICPILEIKDNLIGYINSIFYLTTATKKPTKF